MGAKRSDKGFTAEERAAGRGGARERAGGGAGDPARGGTRGAKGSDKGFTAEERAAMRERAKELKAEERANKNRAAGESALLAKIAEMEGPDRAMAQRLHEIVEASAPALRPPSRG